MSLLNNTLRKHPLLSVGAGALLGGAAALCVKAVFSMPRPAVSHAPTFHDLVYSVFSKGDHPLRAAGNDLLGEDFLPTSLCAVETFTSELFRALENKETCLFIAVPFNVLSDNIRMRPFFAIGSVGNNHHVIPSQYRVPSLHDFATYPDDGEILASILPGYEHEAKECAGILSMSNSNPLTLGRQWREAYGLDAPQRQYDVFASNMCYDTHDNLRVTCHNTQDEAHGCHDLTLNGLPLIDYHIVSVQRI